jgi:DnaJ like chaperone protein
MQIWGKVVGVLLGFMFGRVAGAVLGLIVGHIFDTTYKTFRREAVLRAFLQHQVKFSNRQFFFIVCFLH